jgi:hypothetical protein
MKRRRAEPRHGLIDIRLVVEDPDNEWSHDGEQLDVLCASLRRYGQQRDIVIDATNRCLAGHGVLKAARLLRWKKIGYERSSLEGPERGAYRAADNLLGALRELDLEVYRANLRGIANGLGEGFDPLIVGLLPAEFAHVVGGGAREDADHVGDGGAVTLKVAGVSAADRFRVLALVEGALEGTQYAARIY